MTPVSPARNRPSLRSGHSGRERVEVSARARPSLETLLLCDTRAVRRPNLQVRDVYPLDRILMLRFEDLVASPAGTLRRIEAFLGIAEWQPDRFPNYRYGHGMSKPSLRLHESAHRRLDAIFEPHNARLAETISSDLVWPGRADVGGG